LCGSGLLLEQTSDGATHSVALHDHKVGEHLARALVDDTLASFDVSDIVLTDFQTSDSTLLVGLLRGVEVLRDLLRGFFGAPHLRAVAKDELGTDTTVTLGRVEVDVRATLMGGDEQGDSLTGHLPTSTVLDPVHIVDSGRIGVGIVVGGLCHTATLGI